MIEEYIWCNEASRQFLEKDYLAPGQTLDERVDQICRKFQNYLHQGFNDGEAVLIVKQFKENFKRGWYSLSTPCWTNYGTDRGDPISCFGTYVSDNMESILEAQAEIGMMSKRGGGTSVYLGKLRPRGSSIRNNGKSSGAVHFAQLFEKQIQVISQGSSRRGSCAVYIDINHEDIEEFLGIKSVGHPIQDLSFGVCIPQGWMTSMIDGDPEKRKIWAKVIDSRIQTGYPYIWFTDNVNWNSPDVYQDKKMEITHSNLCLTGDSKIIIKRSLDENDQIITLEDFNILWNIGGFKNGVYIKTEKGFKKVNNSKLTGKTKKLIKITDSVSGKSIKCTPDHKIFTKNRSWICAKDLRETDELDITT